MKKINSKNERTSDRNKTNNNTVKLVNCQERTHSSDE